ncbi:CopD family protein [Halorussus amylolyticus]|uniref:CopD family protein n=1 Tax=Halorussus amylolyticus TaxID=1126242 RepID=UPI0010525367|nr:CopD family protein [Halorussus amylolyticus]
MLAIRTIHLLAMAVVLGGAVATWQFCRRSEVSAATALAVAAGYERAFWAAVGLLVVTGVGNLGSIAPHVPIAETEWGTVFVLKLLALVGFLAVSQVRTLAVHRLRLADSGSEGGRRMLRVSYGATAVWLAAIVVTAGVLAHG